MNESLDLARRAEFTIGETRIRPSLRTITGSEGTATVEPRVMQVLLALHDAKGSVLSREDLLEQCWGGVIVGDDAINRTIAELRRAARETGADIAIETIPRVGYRIATPESEQLPPPARANFLASIDRRKFVAGGLLATTIAGGAAATIYRVNRASAVDAKIEQGRRVLATGGEFARGEAEPLFRSAVDLDGSRADAWGWLARAEVRPKEARNHALQALSLDPDESNARMVLIREQRDLIDWAEWESSILELLEDAPDNTLAISDLAHFYQCVGRSTDNWKFGERFSKLEPHNPDAQHRRAYRHWIFGNLSAADKMIDTSLQLWPRHPWVWNGRLILYAYTDRAQAALSLLEDVENRPTNLTEHSVKFWRAALTAMDTRTAGDIAAAIETCTALARLAPGLAAAAVMSFSYLGELDKAYEVAEGLFFGGGDVVQRVRGKGIRDTYSGAGWGRTQSLFVPANAAFRADSRFPALCERMGHVDYWRKVGVWPDPFVRGSLVPT